MMAKTRPPRQEHCLETLRNLFSLGDESVATFSQIVDEELYLKLAYWGLSLVSKPSL